MMRLISPSGSTVVVSDEKGGRLLGQGYTLAGESGAKSKNGSSQRRTAKRAAKPSDDDES